MRQALETTDRHRVLPNEDIAHDAGRTAPCPGAAMRPMSPHDMLHQIEHAFCQPLAANPPDPWDRERYDEWVARLGADRMRGVLVNLLDQFRNLLSLVDADDSETLHRKAHDVSSTGGMLGFTEVTLCCRRMLEAADTHTERLGRPVLAEALECAVSRLDCHLKERDWRVAA